MGTSIESSYQGELETALNEPVDRAETFRAVRTNAFCMIMVVAEDASIHDTEAE